jgi:hypothetical protein
LSLPLKLKRCWRKGKNDAGGEGEFPQPRPNAIWFVIALITLIALRHYHCPQV